MAYSPARAETRVILLRGWFGVFSAGLDAIADALKAKGIRAEVAGHLQWETAADEIRRERAQGKTDAIVLVGHSQGATNVIDMARVLEAQNVPVALCAAQQPYLVNGFDQLRTTLELVTTSTTYEAIDAGSAHHPSLGWVF